MKIQFFTRLFDAFVFKLVILLKKMQEETTDLALLAGGCFWCTEAVFQRLQGVVKVISGFTGGNIKNPPYREVTTGRTGHAEAVQIHFDPRVVSFRELLEVFFATHDPTTLNRQGADQGTHYRSAIFYTSKEQKETASLLIEELMVAEAFDNPIVTEVTEARPFYVAEEGHHNYYNQHSEQGYCQFVINPKLAKLQKTFKEKLK